MPTASSGPGPFTGAYGAPVPTPDPAGHPSLSGAAPGATRNPGCTPGSTTTICLADSNSVRVSAGVSLLWNSPLGPLRIAYAVPIRSQKEDTANGIPEDRIQRLQFQIGTSF